MTTPHVLIVVCCILLFSIPASVLLRRADREDHYRWQYLPLVDNKEKDGYEYFVSVNTAVRSSRTLTSNCFFKLKGEEKDSGNRVLNDGCRKKTNQEMDIIECKKIMLQLIAELQSVVRTRLNCLIIQNAETIQCRFYDEQDKGFKFIIRTPACASGLIRDLICCECNIMLYLARLPREHPVTFSKMFELQRTKSTCPQGIYSIEMPLQPFEMYKCALCSFDQGQNWSTVFPVKLPDNLMIH
uniref:Uncharacterized protein n=1 Tax=Magallana gigas TaxID=29159 RepID=K1RP58_MAGGI